MMATIRDVLKPTFPLETDRLILRPVHIDDHDDLLAYYSRPDVCRYLYDEPYTAANFADALQRKASRTAIGHEGEGLSLGVVPRDIGRVVGDVSLLWTSKIHRQGEIGFVLNPDFQGRGYAREASQLLLRLGFDELGLHRIVGRLDARNTASARVLQHLGMRQEAHLVENEWVKGEWTDEIVYALLDRDWRATRT
jgi:RimJ/RimL family protein N-acetyltransferase